MRESGVRSGKKSGGDQEMRSITGRRSIGKLAEAIEELTITLLAVPQLNQSCIAGNLPLDSPIFLYSTSLCQSPFCTPSEATELIHIASVSRSNHPRTLRFTFRYFRNFAS